MLALALTAGRWLLGTRAGWITLAVALALGGIAWARWDAYERGREAEQARQVQQERDRTLQQLDQQRRMDDAAASVPRDRDGLARWLRGDDF